MLVAVSILYRVVCYSTLSYISLFFFCFRPELVYRAFVGQDRSSSCLSSYCTFSISSIHASRSMPKSMKVHSMPSLVYSSCSRTNMWWLKNCCSFSLVKLIQSCSKLLNCSRARNRHAYISFFFPSHLCISLLRLLGAFANFFVLFLLRGLLHTSTSARNIQSFVSMQLMHINTLLIDNKTRFFLMKKN